MSKKVRLNGWLLGDAETAVRLLTKPEASREHRIENRQRRRATSTQRWAGRDLSTVGLRLLISGPDAGVRDWHDFILTELDREDGQVATLEHTDSPFFKDYDRIPVRLLSVSHEPQGLGSRRVVTIEVEAAVQGVWVSDSGSYAETRSGWFEKTATGWLRDDGTEFTDAEKPRLRLEDSHDDYPLFVRQSDLAEVKPTRLETFDVDDTRDVTRRYADYDMTGFIHPEPSSTGDVGRYHGLVVPSRDWLLGELPPMSTLGALGFSSVVGTALRVAKAESELATLGFDALVATARAIRAASSTLDSLGFDTATGTARAIRAASSTTETLGFPAASGTATTNEQRLTEDGQVRHSEAGDIRHTEGT